jgi:hypothetical protein
MVLKDMGHVKDLNLICLMLLEVNPKLKIIGADYIGECLLCYILRVKNYLERPPS